jgi:CRP-like cAMP-binding protein
VARARTSRSKSRPMTAAIDSTRSALDPKHPTLAPITSRTLSGRTVVVVATHDDRVTYIADNAVELVAHFVNADREPEDTTLGPGEVLFQQGERGELIYFIESGRLEVFRIRADGTEEHFAEVGAGNYVGELGPILNLPRSASVRAIENSFEPTPKRLGSSD